MMQNVTSIVGATPTTTAATEALKLRNIIVDSLSPKVCIVHTPDAIELLQQHYSNSFTQLCQPYTTLHKKSTIHSLNDAQVELSDFAIQLVDLPDVIRPEEEVDRSLNTIVSQYASPEPYANFSHLTKASLPQFIKGVESMRESITPWYEVYLKTYLKTMPASSVELFHVPIACVVVLSASIKQPVDVLTKMQATWVHDPSPIMKDFLTDPKLLRHFVVLSDSASDPREMLDEIKGAFGSTMVTLVKIGKREDVQLPFRDFTIHFISNSLLPYFESRVKFLNESVSSKRGFIPAVSTWFKATSKKPAETEIYNIELQAKQLADYLFLMRDYGNALLQYRKIAGDRSEKNMKYANNAMEFTGISSFMVDWTRKETEQEIDRAYLAYSKLPLHHRYCVRATLLLAEINKIGRNAKDMVAVMQRAAERMDADDLSAAIMQEQAAFGYAQLSLFRKFALRLVFAGHRFVLAHQDVHAFRCYTFTDHIYADHHWAHIETHIGSVLARQCYLLNRMDRADQYMQKILECTAVSEPLTHQAAHFREYIHILSRQNNGVNISELPFPIIIRDSIRVFLKSSPAAGESAGMDHIWQDMEDSIISSHYPSRKRKYKRKDGIINKCKQTSVGEPIVIELTIRNPLKIPLMLNSLHLIASYTDINVSNGTSIPFILANNGTSTLNSIPPTIHINNNNNDNTSIPNNTDVDALTSITKSPHNSNITNFEVSPVDLTLSPEEKRSLLLRIVPQREGIMEITGIAFEVANKVWGFRLFNLKKKRVNETKGKDGGKLIPTYEADKTLMMEVSGAGPLLEVSLLGIPSSMFHDEVKRVTFELKNSGRAPLTRIQLKLSHPSFFSFDKNLNCTCSPSILSTHGNESHICIRNIHFDPSIISINETLDPGATTNLNVWIRAEITGVHALYFSFYYESVTEVTNMKYRIAKVTTELRVTPSIRCTHILSPSATSLNAYVLALDIENQQPNKSLTFSPIKLECLSSYWSIRPLSYSPNLQKSDALEQLFTITSKESSQLFFMVSPLVNNTLSLTVAIDELSLIRTCVPFQSNEEAKEVDSVPYLDLLLRQYE